MDCLCSLHSGIIWTKGANWATGDRQKLLLLCCLASTGCTGCSCSWFWVPTNLACDIRQSVVGILRCCRRVNAAGGTGKGFGFRFAATFVYTIQKRFKSLCYWFLNELTKLSLKLICLLQRFDMAAQFCLNCESSSCPTSVSPLALSLRSPNEFTLHFPSFSDYLSPCRLLRVLLSNYQINWMTLIDTLWIT